MAKATFGAGCFWGVEAAFRRLNGVNEAFSGYAGGDKDNPTYEEVCTGRTGHAEVVEVDYDPDKITYVELLDTFWAVHDPTTLNRQGPDVGTQYRSAIYFHTPEQQEAARESLLSQNVSGRYDNPIVTEITQASTFYKAEEYHQRYFEKHGRH
tara:strand:+ start:403 stop:861 length:459 start_codon:yes stop_codon:yes gene_type:complete